MGRYALRKYTQKQRSCAKLERKILFSEKQKRICNIKPRKSHASQSHSPVKAKQLSISTNSTDSDCETTALKSWLNSHSECHNSPVGLHEVCSNNKSNAKNKAKIYNHKNLTKKLIDVPVTSSVVSNVETTFDLGDKNSEDYWINMFTPISSTLENDKVDSHESKKPSTPSTPSTLSTQTLHKGSDTSTPIISSPLELYNHKKLAKKLIDVPVASSVVSNVETTIDLGDKNCEDYWIDMFTPISSTLENDKVDSHESKKASTPSMLSTLSTQILRMGSDTSTPIISSPPQIDKENFKDLDKISNPKKLPPLCVRVNLNKPWVDFLGKTSSNGCFTTKKLGKAKLSKGIVSIDSNNRELFDEYSNADEIQCKRGLECKTDLGHLFIQPLENHKQSQHNRKRKYETKILETNGADSNIESKRYKSLEIPWEDIMNHELVIE